MSEVIAAERVPRQQLPWRQLLVSAIVLLAGLGMSVLGSLRLLDYARTREQRAIEEQAASKAEQAQIALNRSLESLGSIRAFHDAHGRFSADTFTRFVKSDAAFHTGTLALGWVPRVTGTQRDTFERSLQPVAGRTASIFEVNWHGLLVHSPARADYFPVQYLVSLTDGELVQGMNLAAMSWLSGALEDSIETGRTAVVLRPRSGAGSAGDYVIQAFTPVYHADAGGARSGARESIAGFAMGVFDISSIFRSVFDPGAEPYNVVVHAVSRAGKTQRIFALGNDGEGTKDPRAMGDGNGGWQREFRVAEQTWRAMFLPRGSASRTSWLAYGGLAAGIAITTLLAAYLFIAQWRTVQVLRLSRSLRDTERRLFDERVAAAVQSRLRERAQASEVAKTHLLQAASHDLRQPMNALGLYLGHALADETHGVPSRRWLAPMQQAFDSLRQMFDGLLDWSRLESGRLQPQPAFVDIDMLLNRLAGEYAEHARAKGLRFTLTSRHAIVLTDAVLLERVLRNLLSNAIRYTDSGGVTLSVRLRDHAMLVRVADSGIGIAPADRERVFAAFERGAASRDRHDGLGLGLAIAAQTAALLGCRLRLTSRAGRGTVVSLSIPHGDAVRTEVAQRARPLADGITGRRLLVVDDDAEQRRHLRDLLERWGARVDAASGIASAREQLAGATFDALIVDLHLGDGNGLSLIDDLRRTPSRPAALLVTGDMSSIEPIRVQYPDLMVLTKPVVPLRLRSVLHYLLSPATVDGRQDEAVVGAAGPVGRAAG